MVSNVRFSENPHPSVWNRSAIRRSEDHGGVFSIPQYPSDLMSCHLIFLGWQVGSQGWFGSFHMDQHLFHEKFGAGLMHDCTVCGPLAAAVVPVNAGLSNGIGAALKCLAVERVEKSQEVLRQTW